MSEIIVGKTAGFCYGVSNTVLKAQEILEKKKQIVYCLGEIVHNQQVIEKLTNKGLKTTELVDEIEEGETVIIRAHGVPPTTYEKLKGKNHKVIDLTCPNVSAIHKIAEDFSSKGFYIFLIGKKNHPETIGTYGFCKDASLIETEEDVYEEVKNFEKSHKNKLLILVQTTFSLAKFEKLVDIIKKELYNKNIELIIKNTICNATRLRQEETEQIAKKVDYMIIVGGKNSSNTKKLYEIAKENCKNAVCIETVNELSDSEIENIRKNNFKVGIMAGASTPKESIDEVIDNIEKKK